MSRGLGDVYKRQAEYTCMSKDSAIRVLKEFERDQIVSLHGREIEVLDSRKLGEISARG